MIVVATTHPIEQIPPILSLLRVSMILGEKVHLLDLTYTVRSKTCLKEFGIPYTLKSYWPIVRFREHPFRNTLGKLRKRLGCEIGVMDYSDSKRRFLRENITRLIRNDDNSILVTTNMTTVALIGDAALRFGSRHIHWSLEFGDRNGIGWSDFDEKAFFRTATFVACERNRARLMMEAENLAQMPFVVPNKSYGHPRTRNLPIGDGRVRAIVNHWNGKKVFLYQGSLGEDRKGIVDLMGWLCEEFPECIVAVMSGYVSRTVQEMEARFQNFYHIPHVTAPHHLEITSHATVGVAVYSKGRVGNLSPLNAVYCAPNKTFEYAGFGIPMLCNDMPGLVDSVGDAGAAICAKLEREPMMNAAHRLLDEYARYSSNASSFFDAFDERMVIADIFSYARR